jgi:hypothetical protein
MVFDPIAVVGIVGFATGLVSFTASTIENVNKRYHDLRDAPIRLMEYQYRLEDVLVDLESWQRTWTSRAGVSFGNSDYEYFWGRTGYSSVRGRLETIASEARSISKLLYGHVVKSESLSLEDPRQFISSSETFKNSLRLNFSREGPRPLAFALYQNLQIKECIERLEKAVSGLSKFSTTTFWRLQDEEDVSQNVVPSTTLKLYKLRAEFEAFTRFAEDVTEKQSDGCILWELVLGRPAVEKSLAYFNKKDTELYFDFIVQYSVLGSRAWKGFQIAYPGRELLAEEECTKTWHRRLSSSDSIPVRKSLPVRDILQMKMKEEGYAKKCGKIGRAKLAQELVNTLVLLHGTAWTNQLCTCCVRFTSMDDDKRIFTYRKAIRPCCTLYRTSEDLAHRGFLLLAVALSELALAVPIAVMLIEAELVFRASSESYSEQELLKLLRRKASSSYQRAVGYCLELDAKLLEREYRPEDLGRCLKQIVQP